MEQIELSTPVYRRLLQRAESFEDSAEDVIRRLLDAAEGASTEIREEEGAGAGSRATPGSILPEREYWLPILKVLADAGGAAQANEVINAVEPLIADRLTEADHEPLQIGEVRWRNRVRFARLRMRERGLLSEDSPRGVWEMTEEGRRFLNQRPPR